MCDLSLINYVNITFVVCLLIRTNHHSNLISSLYYKFFKCAHLTLQVVDLYPKGVWFRKCFLIVWQGTVEVPESVLRTVRVSVTCKDPPKSGEDLRVKVRSVRTAPFQCRT